MSRAALVLMVALLALTPAGAHAQDAQESPTLDRAEELARLGRTEEARTVLTRWWTDGFGRASRRDAQRALWLRGRLTVDPAQAAMDYQRLVIEYPGGPFSDLALFRLAQSAFAAGDSATAAEDVGRLRREYPGSSARRDAEAWLAAAGSPPQPPPAAVPPDSAGAPVPAPAAEPVPARAEPAAPTRRQGRYAVQLGAFASQSRARALQRRVQDAGFDARLALVPGSGLVRVRVGRFEAQDDAEALLTRLRGLGFAATVVLDANREEGIGSDASSP